MARHLLIGDGTAFGKSNGLVNDGAVSVQKMSANGPTELVLGDTYANAPQIRIVAGGSDGKDIVSPWIYGKDVVNYSGAAYSAAAAHTSTLLAVTGSSAAVKEIEVKLTRLDGPAPEFFKFSVDIAVSSNVGDAATAIKNAFNALSNIPDWLNPTATFDTATCTFIGAKRGDVAQGGDVWEYGPSVFNVVVSINPETTQTYTPANGVIDATPGVGDGHAVKAFEESLMGAGFGYYNRRNLPKAPTSQAATGTNYDMYSIVATKDGSSSSQINGVDNLIEVNLALKTTDADSLVVENKLNAYFSGNFTAVSTSH